jgi:hypothetical protein
MAYTRKQIIERISAGLENPATLYRADVLNYKGVSADGERYTEIAAQELLNRFAQIVIPVIHRDNYKTDSHAELAQGEKPEISNRSEEWTAKKFYGKVFAKLGEILDYQTPLKGVKDDDVGKIDLLSYNADERTAYILELKRQDSTETLLRCVLEAVAYWGAVDKERLLKSFGLPDDTELRKAVLVYEGSQPYRDFQQSDTAVRQLMRELGVDFFALNPDTDATVENHFYDTL